jgi:hypothetical protein
MKKVQVNKPIRDLRQSQSTRRAAVKNKTPLEEYTSYRAISSTKRQRSVPPRAQPSTNRPSNFMTLPHLSGSQSNLQYSTGVSVVINDGIRKIITPASQMETTFLSDSQHPKHSSKRRVVQ